MRTPKNSGSWSGRYPAGSPAEWLADSRVMCSIRCLMGDCKHMVDVRLDTLPQDQPWARALDGGLSVLNVAPLHCEHHA